MINYRTLVSQKLYAIRGKEMLERLESAQFFPAPFSNLFRTEKIAENFDFSKICAYPSRSNIFFPLAPFAKSNILLSNLEKSHFMTRTTTSITTRATICLILSPTHFTTQIRNLLCCLIRNKANCNIHLT